MISKCGEFNKTIIPFALIGYEIGYSLIGYEIGYSQLGATRLVGYLPSHIQRALIPAKDQLLPHIAGQCGYLHSPQDLLVLQ